MKNEKLTTNKKEKKNGKNIQNSRNASLHIGAKEQCTIQWKIKKQQQSTHK